MSPGLQWTIKLFPSLIAVALKMVTSSSHMQYITRNSIYNTINMSSGQQSIIKQTLMHLSTFQSQQSLKICSIGLFIAFDWESFPCSKIFVENKIQCKGINDNKDTLKQPFSCNCSNVPVPRDACVDSNGTVPLYIVNLVCKLISTADVYM